MNRARISLLIWGMVFAAHSLQAQSQTFTQVGNWSCIIPSGSPAGFSCPPVTFPTVFGGVPHIVITFTPVAQQANPPVTILPGFPPQKVNLPISGTWVAVGPILLTTTASLRYLVVSVVYAPPGTNGGHSASSVSYSSGTTTATTTSASQTFKATNSLSLSAEGIFGAIGASDTYTFSISNIDSQSLVISKAKTGNFTRPGPGADGINHDEDIIYVVLNPTVNLALSPSSVSWTPIGSAKTPIPLAVNWLNGHDPNMPADIASALQSAGITAADYANILARDPFTDPSYTVDPNRFSYQTSFYYLAPLSPNDPVLTSTINLTDTSASTTGNEVDDTYSVALSLSVSSGDLFDFAKATLKDTNSWEWTNKTSRSTTNTSTQAAIATIGGPAYGYNGLSQCDVYVDTIYHTFAFMLVPAGSRDSTLEGKVVDPGGAPIAGAPVTLIENGYRHPTLTNAMGEYVFYVPWNGTARVESSGDIQAAIQAHSSKRVILHRQSH
jgi:hypothetical protein